MAKWQDRIKDVPGQPGVYLFKDKGGKILYVGKAKNLKKRLTQYAGGQDDRQQIPYLMKEAATVDYTITNTELESLYLENTLIKQYLPRYNIMLRDDKNYAFIKIDYSTEIPQINVARKIEDRPEYHQIQKKSNSDEFVPPAGGLGSRYFGPYSAAYKIRNTLHLLRKIFPYCAADKVSARPCFYYYLHRCPGVCVGKISLEEYKGQLAKIELFLSGNTTKIKQELKTEMKQAAGRKQFEKAARLRDQLRSLEILDEKQTVILPKKVDWDIVSVFVDHGYGCINLFKVRGGKLFDKENFVYEVSDPNMRIDPNDPNSGHSDKIRKLGSDISILQKFLEQYYLETSSAPKIIYTETPAQDGEIIEHIIRSRFGKKTDVIAPQKGKPRELAGLGKINAEEYLKKWLSERAGHLDRINAALEELKKVLDLPHIPERIECYDISNIQGTNAVGSMVVFKNGLPAKSEYRKFKIRSKTTPDDFAMMREMITRRMSRISNFARLPARQEFPISNQNSNSKTGWPLPDLIVIDGGKGQLSAALEALQATSYKLPAIPIIGLAKRMEEIFVPGGKEPITLSRDNPALQLLQRLRDEAHRFGITFHRQLRSKQAVKSALDDIPGIGPKTKKLLKQKFGTVAAIKQASYEELVGTVGKILADAIRRHL